MQGTYRYFLLACCFLWLRGTYNPAANHRSNSTNHAIYYQTIVLLLIFLKNKAIIFFFSSPRGLEFLFILFVQYYSVICRPSDCTVGRPRAEIWTRDRKYRGRNTSHLTTNPPDKSIMLPYYNCANVHFCYFYLWFNAFVLPCTRSTMHCTTLHLCYFELKLSCTINFCFQALFHLCSTLRCCAFLLTHTCACATLQFANIVNSIMSLCIIALVLLFTSANVRLCYTDTPMSFLSHVLL